MLDYKATGLPIVPFLPDIGRLLREGGALCLGAEPGAGKTSLVPPWLAGAGGVEGRIIVIEPRRIAAVSAAARIAELLGEEIGATAGYTVRLDSRAGPSTRIIAMTPGVLVRIIQDDPGLAGIGAIVFDEFHERSLQADLCLALVLEARALRSELLLLLMSATLDSERAGDHIGAGLIQVPGRAHPITTRYSPLAEGRGFEEGFAALASGLMSEAGGDVLAFLPGAAEIDRARRALSEHGVPAFALHGSLPLEAQRAVISPRPGSPRRVVLATSLAETSLTVPRVVAVLDSGLARLSRFHVRTGLNRLVTERESADRAEQRRGRAGRLGPGLCLRTWSEAEALSERTEPEILRSELSALVLESALWGARRPADLPWLDPPPEAAWEAGRVLLAELGAIESSGGITVFGKRMAAMGTEPRLAALSLYGADSGLGEEACLAAAVLSEGETGGDRDLGLRLEGLMSRKGDPSPADGRVIAEARRLGRAAGLRSGQGTMPGKPGPGKGKPGLGALLARAFPDRLGRRTEARAGNTKTGTALFRLPSGRTLRAEGNLASEAWILALDADAGSAEGKVYAGIGLGEADALTALSPILGERLHIEWRGLGYRARSLRMAGAIVLSETALGSLPRGEIAKAFIARLEAEGLGILPWEEGDGAGPRAFLARLRWWTANSPSFWGREAASLGEAELLSKAGTWLGPSVGTAQDGVLDGRSLRRALEGLLDQAQRHRLEEEAPELLALPSGARRRLEYAPDRDPALETRVQELFGLKLHPRILGRPVVFRLLSPAGRPIQVTADIPGFWRSAWAEVRKELRGRYPKHSWPEDPWNAQGPKTGPGSRPGRRP